MAQETITVLKIDALDGIKTVKQLRDSIKGLKDELSGLEIGSEKYQSTLGKLATQQNALRGAMNGTAASLDDVSKAAAGVGQSYNALVARAAALTKEWRSVDQSTEAGRKRFAELGSQINEVNLQLTNMDATIGRHSRNVGNYAGSLGGMNIAMAQIMRELPSLGMNLNTFFLAISNNLPMLFDQIQALRAQNKALIAEGKQGVSVTGAVLKSLVSFNSLMSIGITLLTLYGGKIVEWIGSLFRGKDAVDDLSDAMERMNKAAEFDDAGETVATFQSLARAYIAVGDSAADKQKFIEDYKDEIEKTGIAINDINDADNAFILNSDKFIAAIRLRAVAAAGMDKAAEQYAKGLEIMTKGESDLAALEEERKNALAYYESLQKAYAGTESEVNKQMLEDARQAYETINANTERAKAAVQAEVKAQSDAFMAAGDSYIDAANQLRKQADDILGDAGLGGGGKGGDPEDVTVKRVRLRIKEVKPELDIDYDEFYEDLQDEIDRFFGSDITASQNRLFVALGVVDDSVESRSREVENGEGAEWEKQQRIFGIEQEGYAQRIELYKGFAEEMDKLGVEGAAKAAEARQKAADLETEMFRRQEDAERASAKRRADIRREAAESAVDSVSSILDSLADIYEANSEGDEKAAQTSKNLRIASTIIDTISGATSAYMSTWKAYGEMPILAQTLAIVNAAAVMAAGMANVAKIRSTNVSGDSAPSASSSSIGATVSAPSIPTEVPQTRTLTSASEERRLNERGKDQRVYLVWSDIEAAGRKARVRETETSF